MTPSQTGQVTTLLAAGALRTVFQPIVAFGSTAVVGYEALTRGPAGPLERPDLLFAAAREQGCLAELDEACLRTALAAAARAGLRSPTCVFVNVEPETIDRLPLEELVALARGPAAGLRVVLEVTERALATSPADLLGTVERVRAAGWGVAIDDVGAQELSLALMPLLRPDVVKLDLRLVQDGPGPAAAQVMSAVSAYAERTGALVLAEGIETPAHQEAAQSLGAVLGQGWLFGRPEPLPARRQPDVEDEPLAAGVREPARGRRGTLHLALPRALPPTPRLASPFACLPLDAQTRVGRKSLLLEISHHLEREAAAIGSCGVLLSTFQHARHLTPDTVRRYGRLAQRLGLVAVLGQDVAGRPAPGVRGADLLAGDPLHSEWDVVVLGPHFAAALLARDLGDTGPERDRRFGFSLTYDRDVVLAAGRGLMLRISTLPAAPRDGAVPGRPPADGTGARPRRHAG